MRGDTLALLGIVVLSSCCLPALLALVRGAWQRGDRKLAGLCVAQAVVLALAITGWFSGGH